MKRLKKIVSCVLAVVMILTCIPFNASFADLFADKAQAVNATYNASAAAAYAKRYALSYNREWYFYYNGGDCANFVSQCLYMGGLPMTSQWYCYDGAYAYTTDPNNVWIRAQELCDYLVSIGGQIIWNPSPSQISIGDVMFYDWNGGRLDHSAFVSDIIGGTPVVCGHTTDESLSKLDYIWTYGRSANRRCVVKLHGNNCAVANTALDYDRYLVNTGRTAYTNPGGGNVVDSAPGRWTARVVETRTIGGVTYGKYSHKGTWAWISLAGSRPLGHTNKFNVDHIMGAWFTVTKPTCIANGQDKRICNVCGYTEYRTTAMTGHTPGTEATCTTPQICTVCNETLKPALGHIWGDWYLKVAPTCIRPEIQASNCGRCGYERTKTGDLGDHSWKATYTSPTCTVDGSSTLKCEYCNKTKVDLTEGSWTTTWVTWPNNIDKSIMSPEMYKERTEYRYRNKVYTTSNSSSLDGWTKYGEYWGDFGSFSDWSTTPAYESDTVHVETDNRLTGYNVSYYACRTTSGQVRHYRDYSINGQYGSYGYSSTYGEHHNVWTVDTSAIDINNPIAPGASNSGAGDQWGYNKGNRNAYSCNYYDHTGYLVYIDSEARTTYYRYQTRQKVYQFWKWPDWNAWSTTHTNGDAEETRNTYLFNNAALGHNWGAEITEEPDCYNDGRVYKVCSRCGAEVTVRTLAKLNHPSWSAWEATSYTVDGTVVVAEQRHCLLCGKIETRGHTITSTVVDPTCTEDGYTLNVCSDVNCGICGDAGAVLEFKTDYVDALGHDMDTKPVEIKSATCTEDGINRYYCLRECGYYEDEAIPKLGHEYTCTIEKGSCTEDGQKVYTCVRADDEYIEIIPAQKHEMGEWVDEVVPTICGEEGIKRSYCQHTTETDEYVACDYYEEERYTLDHDLTPKTHHEATCLDWGYWTWECTVCKEQYMSIDDDCPPLGHNWSDWKAVTEPTCTEDGIDSRHCMRCGITDERITPPLGHDMTSKPVSGNCSNAAGTHYYCQRSNCDYEYYEWDGNVADAHTMGEWKVIKAPTCTQVGYKKRQCQNIAQSTGAQCTHTEIEIIPATGHNYVDEVIAPFCTTPGYIKTTCSNPGCNYSSEIIDPEHHEPLGHDMGAWYVTTEATYSDFGVEQRDCQRVGCGYNEVREYGPLVNDVYTATFVTRTGETVEVVEFAKDATKLSHEPAVPVIPGWNGVWEEYTVSNRDFIIRPIYTPVDEPYVDLDKTAEVSDDESSVNIKLSATCDGEEFKSITSEPSPLDIVLVVDQSGSMTATMPNSSKSRQTVLIETANALLGYIYDSAKTYDVDHRVAVVGFARGLRSSDTDSSKTHNKDNRYLNTGILSTKQDKFIRYDNINNSDYTDALMSINVNNSINGHLISAVNRIQASGATAADKGLEMAKGILSAAKSTSDAERKQIVIFLTDGEPTIVSDFSSTVANAAFAQAKDIKDDSVGADIYSIGVGIDKKSAAYDFIDYVSSNYIKTGNVKSYSTKSLTLTSAIKNTERDDYTYLVSDVSSMQKIFNAIWDDASEVKSKFENITLVDTVSKYFTMTTKQEADFRARTIAEYGIRNDQISVVRNEDGTTRIAVESVNPKQLPNGKFNVTVSFDVSPNRWCTNAGMYPTNTTDAGIKLDGVDDYEAMFTIPVVELKRNDCLAIFNINGETYETRIIPEGNAVVAPTFVVPDGNVFSGWNTQGLVMKAKCMIFEASLSEAPYKVTWHIGEKTMTEWYREGDVISEPEAPDVKGMTFVGWDNDVPVTMSAEDLEFTAVYEKHECIFERTTVISGGSCLEKTVYETECMLCHDKSKETVKARGKHSYVATLSERYNEDEMIVPLICSECGEMSNIYLDYYKVEEDGEIKLKVSLTLLDEANSSIQPGDPIKIKFILSDHDIDKDHLVTVYHVTGQENGEDIMEEVPSEMEYGYVIATCKAFSEYILIDNGCAYSGGTPFRKMIYKLVRAFASGFYNMRLISKSKYNDILAKYSWGWYQTGIYYYNLPNSKL